jgi:hypothetical protein
MEIDNNVAVELGFNVAGNGLSGGVNVGFQMSTGGSKTTTNTTTTTTSYTLADNNSNGSGYAGDYFSVNVKKDPVYGTPMFETVAGGSQCPAESGTIALDSMVITTSQPVQTGITANATNFVVDMYNLSADPTPGGQRQYILFLNQATNPYGASVLINNNSYPGGLAITIPNQGGHVQATVTVGRNIYGPIYNYNYDNLQFILSDNCSYGGSNLVQTFLSNPHQYSSVNLSADFVAPVSNINLVKPANNWLANTASKNTVPVIFSGYDTSKLTTVTLQYASAVNRFVAASANWATIVTKTKANLGKSLSTSYNWNIAGIPDGSYSLRLMVTDQYNNTSYSTVATGLIDRTPPALFGSPKPAGGIYTAGSQISFSYTELINNTGLRASMVHMQDLTVNKAIGVQLNAFANTLVIVPTINVSTYTGHMFRVIADSVADLYGNIKTTPDTLYFTVGKTTFGTGKDAVNLTLSPDSLYEDAAGAMALRFTRNAADTLPTVIYYTLAGNAVYNSDYTVTYNYKPPLNPQATGINGAQGAVVLPADSSTVIMYIHPVRDTLLMPNKLVTVTLSPGGNYSIGSKYTVTATILNHSLAAPVITANKSTTLCSGDSVILTTNDSIGNVPVTLKWSTGATTTSIKVKTSGTYSVKATAANGFTSYSAKTLVSITCGSPVSLAAQVLSKNSAVVSWGASGCAVRYALQFRPVGTTTWVTDTLKTNVDTITGLTANTTYQWQVAVICRYPLIIISGYTAGANFTTPASLVTSPVVHSADYTKAISEDGFGATVFPNPATASANVVVKGFKGTYGVMVIDMKGAVIWKAEKVTDANLKVPLTNFAAGVYMVVVFDKHHTGRLKLVKE